MFTTIRTKIITTKINKFTTCTTENFKITCNTKIPKIILDTKITIETKINEKYWTSIFNIDWEMINFKTNVCEDCDEIDENVTFQRDLNLHLCDYCYEVITSNIADEIAEEENNKYLENYYSYGRFM